MTGDRPPWFVFDDIRGWHAPDSCCNLACGRMVICGARHVGPVLPVDFEEARLLPEPGVLVGYTFAIGEEPPFYREPKRKWRADRWER